MNLSFDATDLRPVIEQVLAEVLGKVSECNLADGRLAYSEKEAAAALGVATHVLRDERLRGNITATKVASRYAYEKSELLAYLAKNRN